MQVLNMIRSQLAELKEQPITEATLTNIIVLQESLESLRGQGLISPVVKALAKELDEYLHEAGRELRDRETFDRLRGQKASCIETLVGDATVLVSDLDALKQDPTAPSDTPPLLRPVARRAVPMATGPVVTPVPAATPTLCPGLNNASANCWLNSLMQMITVVPSLETAYRTFAQWKIDAGTRTEKYCGRLLIEQLDLIKADQADRAAVSRADTQQIRVAFFNLFRNVYGEPVFSYSEYQHEDLQEGIMKIMEGYQAALAAQRQPLPACYKNVDTVRYYRPTGVIYDTDPDKLAKNDYSALQPGNTTTITSPEFHIFLPLQDVPERTVNGLLLRHFRQNTVGNDLARYLGRDGRLHEHMLTAIRTQFTEAPEELVICVGRFAAIRNINDPDAQPLTQKINDPVPFKRVLTLPREASAAGEEITMELDAFAVHGGGLSSGHYISYKKIDGVWIECNDRQTTIKTEQQIDEILKMSYLHHYRRITPAAALAYRVPQVHPAIAPYIPVAIEVPAYQQLVMEALAAVNTRKSSVAALEGLCEFLSRDLPIDTLDSIGPLRKKLYGPAWLRDYMTIKTFSKNIYYGESVCERTPATLKRPCPPLFATRGNLAEQTLEWQRDLLQVDLARALALQIRAVWEAMHNPSLSNEEILRLYNDLPADVCKALEDRVCFYDITKKGREVCDAPRYHYDYGRIVIERDIRALYDVKDRVPAIESLADDQRAILLSLLDTPSASSEDLRKVFDGLATGAQNILRGFVYHAHVEKFGAQQCRGTEKGSYGKVTIDANPRVLLEKREGAKESIIEQELHAAQLAIQDQEHTNYLHRLEAYEALLKNAIVTNEQLIKAFEFLEIPSYLKDTIFVMVAEANNSSSAQKGMQFFHNNPRCIEEIFEKIRNLLRCWKEQKRS